MNQIIETWGSKLEEKQKQYKNGLLGYPKDLFFREMLKFSHFFNYSSNAIEGNPLSRMDVSMLLHDREPITPANKPLWATLEIVNHQSVFKTLLQSKSVEFTVDLIKTWHKALFFQTKPQIAGVIRGEKIRGENNIWNVKINGSTHTPPDYSEVPTLLRELMGWYHTQKEILHPVILAGFFHFRFETIHPFGDGNGRCGRLLMNKMLYDAEYPLFNVEFAKRKPYFNAFQNEQFFLNWYIQSYCKYGFFDLYHKIE
jgi:Fic family protein